MVVAMYKIAFTAFVKIDQIQGLAVYDLQKRIFDIQFMIFRFLLDNCELPVQMLLLLNSPFRLVVLMKA